MQRTLGFSAFAGWTTSRRLRLRQILFGTTFGWISAMGARYVSVVTRDGREYLTPNEDLIPREVVNWSHSSNLVRLDIRFGVAYRSDPHL